MKGFTIFAVFIVSILLFSSSSRTTFNVSAQDGKKPPEIIILGKEAKLGQITFHHLDHITKNRSVDGTKPLACVECHHTAQPASAIANCPPLKTVWPADRTTTLTAELLEKDPTAPPVNICTDCHARAETKPKLLPEIPQLKFEGSAEPTILTNQQAFHRKCGSCHDAAVAARPALTPPPPTSKKCMQCHKKAAAKTGAGALGEFPVVWAKGRKENKSGGAFPQHSDGTPIALHPYKGWGVLNLSFASS